MIATRVVGVHDGDTLTALTDDKRQLKVRLHGIDVPELGQPFAQAATAGRSGTSRGQTQLTDRKVDKCNGPN